MRRDTAVSKLREHRAELKALGVLSLALFGSVARDEATSESDVDLLVEFEGAGTFDKYMGVKQFVEDLLGCRVDLVTRKALRPRSIALVQRDALRVA